MALPLRAELTGPSPDLGHQPAPVHLRLVVGGRPSPATFRRRRVLALVLLVATVAALWLALGRLGEVLLGNDPAFVPEQRPTAMSPEGLPIHGGQELEPGGTYVVQPGDTMWSIAADMQPSGDLSSVVRTMIRANGGPELDVGDHITLPG